MIKAFREIKYWFWVNFNKYHLKTVWTTFKVHPHDYSYTWQIEKARLEELKQYFIKVSDTFDHKSDIYWINKCLSLLDILINDGDDAWLYYNEVGIKIDKDNINNIPFSSLISFFDKEKINISNAERFYPGFFNFISEDRAIEDVYYHELYLAKVKYLYYEILKNYVYNWGD